MHVHNFKGANSYSSGQIFGLPRGGERRRKMENNQGSSEDINPIMLNENTAMEPYFGLYSMSGMDILGMLAKVASRTNPKIILGPVDLSSSFVVVDAKQRDYPIIYASSNFETLTGYTSKEILGLNCRFLQAPGGLVQKGQRRTHVDDSVIFQMKKSIESCEECQFLNINYKKSGEVRH